MEEVKVRTLLKKLSLDVNQIKNLNITTFGTEKFKKQKCSVVTVNIELVDSSELAISALSYPVSCYFVGCRYKQIPSFERS